MGLKDPHDSYGSWHLYICRFPFGILDHFVVSLLFLKGTSCFVIRRNWSRLDRAMQIFRGQMPAWFPLLSTCFVEFDTYSLSLVHYFGSFLLQDMFVSLQVFAFEVQSMAFPVNVLLTWFFIPRATYLPSYVFLWRCHSMNSLLWESCTLV